MKSLIATACLISFFTSNAQRYDTLDIGLMTTVHLIFDSPVLEYDLGSGTRIEVVNGEEQQVTDVLITKVGDRLKLAAAITDFETTNLFIETETAYFNFILRFNNRPETLSYYMSDQKSDKVKAPSLAMQKVTEKETAALAAEKETKILEMTLFDLATKVGDQPEQAIDIGQESQRMKYFLNGIYVKGNYLFFRINIINEGNVKFDLGYEGFFIKDKPNRGLKKTTKQIPEPVKDLYILNRDVKVVERRREVFKVYVFEKFTLDPKKIFVIEFWEDGQGQRKVEVNIPSDKILAAKTF